jgi:hypothetical protein
VPEKCSNAPSLQCAARQLGARLPRNWRLIAILCATASLLQTVGMNAPSMRAKVVPYVVAIDSLGHQVAAGPVEQASGADDRLKRAELFQWIEDHRTVTSDDIRKRRMKPDRTTPGTGHFGAGQSACTPSRREPVWVATSYNPRSFDSRYFGPIPLQRHQEPFTSAVDHTMNPCVSRDRFFEKNCPKR